MKAIWLSLSREDFNTISVTTGKGGGGVFDKGSNSCYKRCKVVTIYLS